MNNVENRDKVENEEQKQGHNRQVKSFDTIMLNPVTMHKVYVFLDEDELDKIPISTNIGMLYKNMYSIGKEKGAFVRLSYLNSTGKKFM